MRARGDRQRAGPIRRFLYDVALGKKLLAMFILFAALPVVFYSLADTLVVDPILIRGAVTLSLGNLQKLRESLVARLRQYESILLMMVSDSSLNRVLTTRYREPVEAILTYYDFSWTYIQTMITLGESITGITFYLQNDTFRYDNYYFRRLSDGFGETPRYSRILREPNRIHWFVDVSGTASLYRVVSIRYYARTNTPERRDSIASMTVSLDGLMRKLYQSKEKTALFIADANGAQIGSLNGTGATYAKYWERISTKPSGVLGTADTKDGNIVLVESLYNGWKLIQVIDSRSVFQEQRSLRITLNVVLLAILLLTAGFVFLFTRGLTARIRQLTEKVNQIRTQNSAGRKRIEGGDEIGAVGAALDEMAGEIDYLIDERLREQTEHQRLELDLLQAKINPHFLYNTLSGISWHVRKSDRETSERLLRALAQFYRKSLGKGGDIVTVRDEVELLQSYAEIMVKLKGDVAIQIRIPDELLGSRINCFTLQPLVENAIKHGYRDDGSLAVTVSGWREAESAVIVIEDDGVGISPERARLFNSGDEIGSSESGFGLRNVSNRLSLRFGPTYRLTIEERNGGARIRVTVPFDGHDRKP